MNDRDRTFPPPVLRWSELKLMRKSPAHFRAAYEHPRKPTAAMAFGTLVDALALEGGDPFVVYKGKRDNSNRWKDFKAQHEGTTIVTSEEHKEAMRVVRALRSDPIAGPLLDGEHHRDLRWNQLGRACGGEIDVIRPATGEIVDVKTASYAEPGYFTRSALRMGYHAQLAWYLDGARANGYDVSRAHLVVVETEPPFAVVTMPVTARALDEGRKLVRSWMERVRQCEEAGAWPGYVQSPFPLDIIEDAGLILDGEEVLP